MKLHEENKKDKEDTVRKLLKVFSPLDWAFLVLGFIFTIGMLIYIQAEQRADPCNVINPPIPKLGWCGKVELQDDKAVTLISPEGEYIISLTSTTYRDVPSFQVVVKHPEYADPLTFVDQNAQGATADLVMMVHVGDVVIQRWKGVWYLWYKNDGSGALSLKTTN